MSASSAVQPGVRFLAAPETVVEADGAGESVELGTSAGRAVLIILRITEIIEQESLHVSIWGSADGNDWGARPLFWFPQQFYRGPTPASLDLSQRPEIKFLQARWQVNRWGRGYPRPRFKFAVELQEAASD